MLNLWHWAKWKEFGMNVVANIECGDRFVGCEYGCEFAFFNEIIWKDKLNNYLPIYIK